MYICNHMNSEINISLWKQFGAAIDMLENSMKACPEELWNQTEFWYRAYHTLFFLDYYLSDETPESEFRPPAPFTLSEFNPEGEMPPRTYTKEELLGYLQHCRDKCREAINNLDVNSDKRFVNEYRNYSVFEIMLYNMRHVQHHMAQLNLILRQNGIEAPDWVSQTKEDLY